LAAVRGRSVQFRSGHGEDTGLHHHPECAARQYGSHPLRGALEEPHVDRERREGWRD
jgi:hypothetical protein